MSKYKNSNKDSEEKKRKKREKERERRRKIREDPERREIQKQKEREKYLRQKEQGVKKNINELTPREQRIQRKKWKQNSKNYRDMKKRTRELLKAIEENTPPQSESEQAFIPDNLNERSFSRKEVGRRIANRNKIRRHREKKNMIKQYENKICKLNIKLEKYKRRYNRIVRKNTRKPKTPPSYLLSAEKRVDHYIEKVRKEPEKIQQIKRNLFLGEVIKDQLTESYQKIDSTKSKQFFKKIIHGKIVKRKKLSTDFAKLFKYSISKKSPIDRQKRLLFDIKEKIQEFLEEDTCSRVCPGKKDYVTKNNVQHQKRFLNNTLKNLHFEFSRKYPTLKVSYAFFCRWRPFWIVPMKINDRETCKCITHANMELFVQRLHQLKIIVQKNPPEVLESICCDPKNEQCLYRNCIECNHKKIEYQVLDKNQTIGYFQWVYIKENYFDRKTRTKKCSSKIGKKIIEKSIVEAIDLFEQKIKLFMGHQARIEHQYTAICQLKRNLTSSEILVHCDFSENYNLKYTEETQAFHFGGSRQQITLHTVVVYSLSEVLTNKSFCSLSTSLQHDAGAIWAHLFPVLMQYINEHSELNTLHFLSDSPATQYRNKYMFSFLALHVRDFFPKIKYITWNYQEAGHGKGAPDGIGGVCKRNADIAVTHGKDIPDIEILTQVLIEKCPGIKILNVGVAEITKMTNLLQQENTKTFVGTMRVHQIKTAVGSGILHMKELSCFECNDICEHYALGTLSYKDQLKSFNETTTGSDSSDDSEFNIPLSFFKARSEAFYNEVYGSHHKDQEASTIPSTSKEVVTVPVDQLEPEYQTSSTKGVVTGTYVLVQFEGQIKKNLTNYRYVAVCQSDMDPEEGEVKVAFLKICDVADNECEKKQLFKLDDEDVSFVSDTQIIAVLSAPDIILKGNRMYYKFKDPIDIFEKP